MNKSYPNDTFIRTATVSDAPDIPPWQVGMRFRFVPKPNGGLADDLQFKADGGVTAIDSSGKFP